ncbi:MAG: UDP-2,3-diacylglucosamine diphosphatase [Muribaculum sp.]|nr:UDP-2,3-diacylglucosamine diphosphatase [Muribaculaceae bacterium]MCM1080434.1 UDP-2,3-diacylglucosamine diphosphatase [Muribaculum sp.]
MSSTESNLPEGKKIYFISDMHLGASYLKPAREYENRVVEFLDSIAADAAELYMLGDVLDYWFEYRTVVPRGYIRFFGSLARLADSGVKIHWFIGNHDIWLFDYLKSEIGIEVIDGWQVKQIAGKKFFLSHGDGVGKLPFAFRTLRAIFRNRICQKLYSAIHPRWTIPFALNWSKSSRDFSAEIPVCSNPEAEPLIIFARDYLKKSPDINYFVFGHRHVLLDYTLSPGHDVIILGDWIHHFSYAKFDGTKMEICRYCTIDSAKI